MRAFLRQQNGLYAFESALHIFPSAAYEGEMTLSRWNSYGLWRHEYGELIGKEVFFAEDAFGDQFCFKNERVCSFDAETGETKIVGQSIEEWAESVLKDPDFLTGYPTMHAWQERHGPIPIGTRLMPKIPFVLGGKYSLDNLYVLGSVSAMKSRGNLARQLRNLPDGAKVEFRIIE